MQGIDTIIEKIISDAKADARQTEAQTRKQIDEARQKHEAQTQKQIDGLSHEFAEKRAQLESRAETMADLEKRRSVLAIKRELVEEAFSEAQSKLLSLPDADYLAFIEKLMRNLDDKRGEIIVGKNEKRIDQKFIDGINATLDSAYKLAGERGNFYGGFVLRNGRVETNCTVGMLISQAKRTLEQKVAGVLFDESGA
jgi:V/A-type H+-transporting ATPase subunit E